MKEILEEIKNEIDAIRKEQKDLEELAEDCKRLLQEQKELESQRDEIRDVNSGFYRDASQKLEEKHNEFIRATNKRMHKDKEIEQLIAKKKEEIKKHIADKKHYIDENRNINIEALNGKNPKEEFIELDDWSRRIDTNFNRAGLDVILEEINKFGSPLENEEYKITIGREGSVEYNGSIYFVHAEDIKYGLGLNSIDKEDLENYLKTEIGMKEPTVILQFIGEMVKDGKMDMTVVHAIYSTNMKEENKILAFKQYLNKVKASEYKRDNKSKVDVIYDMEELSKTTFFGRLFGREVDTDEKIKIYENAIKAEKNGIGKIEGRYKTSYVEKLLNWRNKKDAITRFPVHHRIKEIEEVAYAYNEMGFDEKGKKVTNKELQRAFKERLHSNAQLDDENKNKFSESQIEELRDLVEEHESSYALTEGEENEI